MVENISPFRAYRLVKLRTFPTDFTIIHHTQQCGYYRVKRYRYPALSVLISMMIS
jgi:hypothetical protein